jgi:hypothetical protein
MQAEDDLTTGYREEYLDIRARIYWEIKKTA